MPIAQPRIYRNLNGVRPFFAEFLGSALLVAMIVGSGIAAERLSPSNIGLQLLENSLAIMLGLAVLIVVFAPISGAHFNPVVTLVAWFFGRGEASGFSGRLLPGYVGAQILGAISGSTLANVMFDLSPWQLATSQRYSAAHGLAEVLATAGLVIVIFGLSRTDQSRLAAPVVGAYIGSAIWFTSSTSFANPAVTIGRIFSDTFTGIAPSSVPGFILAQLAGAVIGAALVVAVFPQLTPRK